MIIKEKEDLLYQTNANNKKYITLIECVNDLDYTFSPILILIEK